MKDAVIGLLVFVGSIVVFLIAAYVMICTCAATNC